MGDKGNDLSLCDNGILQEILSQRVGCVGSLVLMLKISSCSTGSTICMVLFRYFGFQYFQLHLFAFILFFILLQFNGIKGNTNRKMKIAI